MSLTSEVKTTRKPKVTKATDLVTTETVATEPPVPTKPKSKMSWAEKMASLPPEEAAKARAKAAAASRASKARKQGTTPEQNVIKRLEAKLTKNREMQALLATEEAEVAAALAEAQAILATVKEVASA